MEAMRYGEEQRKDGVICVTIVAGNGRRLR